MLQPTSTSPLRRSAVCFVLAGLSLHLPVAFAVRSGPPERDFETPEQSSGDSPIEPPVHSDECAVVDVRLVLQPLGTAAVVRSDEDHELGRIRKVDVSGNNSDPVPKALSLLCGKRPRVQLISTNTHHGKEKLLAKLPEDGTPYQRCIAPGSLFQLAPALAEKLFPDGSSSTELVPGTCLDISIVEPVGTSAVTQFSKAVTTWWGALTRYSFENVAKSPLLTVESWLYYASGSNSKSLPGIQDGSTYAELLQEYAPLPELQDPELESAMDTDLERYSAFADPRMRMPRCMTEGQAQEIVRQVIRKRLAQKRTQCFERQPGDKVCEEELYSQALSMIAGSLVVVTLEARAEAEALAEAAFPSDRGGAGKPAKLCGELAAGAMMLHPGAVAFKILSVFLDSDIGSFQQPAILFQRLNEELSQVFSAYFTGDDSYSKWRSWVYTASPRAEADTSVQAHMRMLVVQFYCQLMGTAFTDYDSVHAARKFWRYFLRTVDYKEKDRRKDKSVAFFRTSLLAALDGPQVLITDAPDEDALKIQTFKQALKIWSDMHTEDADDPEASAVVGHFARALKATMRAPFGLAGRVAKTASTCLLSSIISMLTNCGGSLSAVRLWKV